MPTYRYECFACGQGVERNCPIIEMEEFERTLPACARCGGPLRRDWAIRRHIAFRAGFYEHVSEDGKYCASMQDLVDACRRAGTGSQYADDFGGAFGAKQGRWV